MIRFRDAALVVSLFGALPVQAGTSIANSGAMDTPVLSLASIPVTGEVTSAPAAEGATGVFEALIADFRYGEPEMGAVPYLPVPPPYRMRAEEAAEGGDEAPVGGNSGNVLPLSLPYLPMPSAAMARPEAPVLQLDTPVAQPEWAEGIGERIVWLSDNRVNDAQIRLNPGHLGPIEVRVSVGEDQARVSFIAHHAATREALEAATPRLREMLAAHGFGSVNVNISHESSGERTAQNPQPHHWIARDSAPADEYAAGTGARLARPSSKALDAYA